jgi:hypothetical protein
LAPQIRPPILRDIARRKHRVPRNPKTLPPSRRPLLIQVGVVEQAQKLCGILGATDRELAGFFNVALRTIANWQAQHPEFREALEHGKVVADNRVEKSLYHRAVGYTFDDVKIFYGKDGVAKVGYRKHVPPDTIACIFWLKNRRPEQWREKSAVAVENVTYAVADHPPSEDEWIAKHVTPN